MENLKYIAIIFLLGFTGLNAQTTDDDGLGSEDIVVIKEYEARIADAQKINTKPTTQEVDVEKQVKDLIKGDKEKAIERKRAIWSQ